MSKLSQLQGKSKTYKIGEIELELRPLTLEDMNLIEIDENSSQEQQMKQTKKLLSKVLKQSVPDATDEEIDQLGVNYMKEIMYAIMDVNGLQSQTNIKDVIKNRQAQAKSSRR